MKIGMAFLAMLFMLSCTNTADDTINYELDNIESKNFNAKNQAVTVPFKSSFSTSPGTMENPVICDDLLLVITVPFKSSFSTSPGTMENPVICDDLLLVIQVGGGEATHLGAFTTAMSFCVDPDFYYFGVVGTFFAANGDELWISIEEGQVIPNEDLPDPYSYFFTDEFTFVGGTGRFIGATGGGTTNSFVEADLSTDHQWNGTLTMSPGKN